jgi:ribosomal protein L37AE/L43A
MQELQKQLAPESKEQAEKGPKISEVQASDDQEEPLTAGRSSRIHYVFEPYAVFSRYRHTPMEWKRAYGRPSAASIKKFIQVHNEALEPGGVNEHLGRGSAFYGGRIVDQLEDSEVVAEYEDKRIVREYKNRPTFEAGSQEPRSREAAAGPHTLMTQLYADLKRGRLDEKGLDMWGHASGHAMGMDYVVGAGGDIVTALLDYAAGRKDEDRTLQVIKRNIRKAIKDNDIFKGVRAEQAYDVWKENRGTNASSVRDTQETTRDEQDAGVWAGDTQSRSASRRGRTGMGLRDDEEMILDQIRSNPRWYRWKDEWLFKGDPLYDDWRGEVVKSLEKKGLIEPKGGKASLTRKGDGAWENSSFGMSASSGLLRSRRAMYWMDKGRSYRMTKQEQSTGGALCPKCKGEMTKEPFTRKEKLWNCQDCGFKVPSGSVHTGPRIVDVEMEDGKLEIEIAASRRGRMAVTV